nr:zinc finger BED domain-containing protein DAYSLEEPER-like [Ipomoea trifida]
MVWTLACRSTGATGWCSGLVLPSSTAVVELDTEITSLVPSSEEILEKSGVGWLFVMDSISLNQTIDTIADDVVDGMTGLDSTLPEKLKALICTRNWLHDYAINTEESLSSTSNLSCEDSNIHYYRKHL